MFLWDKYDRARKWQKEQNEKLHPEDYNGEKLYEPTIEESLEKGDILAMMISGFLTIVPVVSLLLIAIVLISMLIFRLI